ncbi:hypothetical protein BLJAPNOD_02957 [Ensifer sp. M14]|uniref:hypothetical protein n=1 Tax=Ensifer sp. M14 TaxID=2203782 RepID=UPI000E1E1CEA|nr:hypothetical protein [Ensifer sp. M14]RDL51815.1 hypothetical protein BLJAPNOD_02957 [Ensifer sp. M14]
MNVASFLMRNPRQKREDLGDYVLRVVLESLQQKDARVRAELVDEALSFYRGRIVDSVEEAAEERAGSEKRRLEAQLAELKAKHQTLGATHQRLVTSYPMSVPVREAEEARLGAYRLARERAALLAEYPPGTPTMMSEDIREKVKDPKPKWAKS